MGWLLYTLVLVCCVSVRADEAQTQAELNDLNQKLEKVQSGVDTYPPSNGTDDRLERIEILVNLLLEDVYDVRVDQELLKREIMSRLEEIEGKLGGYQPTNQTGWIEFMLGAHFKDFRPTEIKADAPVPKVHTDCRAAYAAGWVRSGVYRISPDGQHEMDVVCEQEEHGGGWTVLQRRLDGSVNFHRSWDDYKNGFGNLDGEFWIGNQNINTITENRKQTLRVELQYEGEGFFHVDYTKFWVANEGSKYKLHVAGFSGEEDITGDSLSYHNEKLFSTKNMDNDNDCGNCAQVHRGGWWYDNCTQSNLNGVYGGQSHNGILWKSWGGFSNSLISVRMMVRGEGDEGDKATTGTTRTSGAPTTTGSTEPTTTQPQHTTATTTLPPSPTTTAPSASAKNCQEVYTNGGQVSGVYTIYPGGTDGVRVYCEQRLQEGGWTVIQSRIDGSVDFYLGWASYKQGFGSAAGEYWIGNDHLNSLTANKDTQLLVELEQGGDTAYARYNEFWVLDEANNYKLHVGSFSNGQNNPGDSLTVYHNTSFFTTKDRDNDGWSGGNMAVSFKGAWWYSRGAIYSNLNGLYGNYYYIWGTWRSTLTASRMMIKTK